MPGGTNPPGIGKLTERRHTGRYYEHLVAPAIPVSISLPLREDRYIADPVIAVFDNLLSDHDDIRRRLAERSQAEVSDAYSLLAAIGRDCVGALRFVPDGTAVAPPAQLEAVTVSGQEVADLVKDLARNPLGIGPDREFRISLAGAQERRLLRIPQEDCCQALSIPRSKKKRVRGRPRHLRPCRANERQRRPDEDQRVVFKAQIVLWLLGATDGHAKNFSIRLAQGGRSRLIPLYDIVSVQPSVDVGQISHNQNEAGDGRWYEPALRRKHNSWPPFCANSQRLQPTAKHDLAVALVAYLLLRMAHGLQSSVCSLLAFTRLVANNLMHRRPFDRLLHPPPVICQDQRQWSLDLCQA